MQKNIPDLRPEFDEITYEHSSVLLERIKAALKIIEGHEYVDLEFVDSINPERMKDIYSNLFEMAEFNRLFQTEFGKGVLVGCFVHQVMEETDV